MRRRIMTGLMGLALSGSPVYGTCGEQGGQEHRGAYRTAAVFWCSAVSLALYWRRRDRKRAEENAELRAYYNDVGQGIRARRELGEILDRVGDP